MIKTPGFSVDAETTGILEQLRKYLRQRGIRAYLVGGMVRDCLLGRTSKDIDLVVPVNAIELAGEVARLFEGRMVVLDEVHQTVRVVLTRTRGRWQIDFSAWQGETIEEDLGRRDFTINAMAIDIASVGHEWADVELVDPLGGLDDLGKRLIKTVSAASFKDDPARLLRAVRFAAILGFSIDPGTEGLIQRDNELLSAVAGERLRDELRYIFECRNTSQSLRYLDRVDLLPTLVPELDVTRGVSQPKEHYWDVFNHCLQAVAALERMFEIDNRQGDEVVAAVPRTAEITAHFDREANGGWSRKALLKWAALFHDIGKPATRTFEEGGRMRFLGHSQEGVRMVGGIMERLRFGNREIKMVKLMIEHHLRPANLANVGVPTGRAIYRYFRDTGDVGIETLFLSLADHLAARGPALDVNNWREHCEATADILRKYFHDRAVVTPPKLIDGRMIMEKFGLPPGHQIGELLEAVREAQASGEVSTVEQALDLVSRRLGRS